MKKILATLISVITMTIVASAATPSESTYSQSAKVSICNRSEDTITVKVMKSEGGLHSTVCLSPRSSRTVSFPKSGNFYTKTKAEKGWETLYKMGSQFNVYCENDGYTERTLEFYISSTGGASGQSISKSEFEKNY